MKLIFYKLFIVISILSLSFLIESCTIAKLSGKGSVPLIMNQPQTKVNVVQKVEASKQILFDYTGAFDVSDVLKDIMIDSNIDAIINITITIKVSVGDYLLNVITFGLANARTFEVSGEAITAPEGLSSILDTNIKPIAVFNSLEELSIENIPTNNKLMIVKSPEGIMLYEYNGNL